MTRVLVASPPVDAIGGVAQHTRLVTTGLPDARPFDQWWPLSVRSQSPLVRLGIHLLGLARWTAALLVHRPEVVHLQMSAPGARRDLLYLRIAHALRRPVVAHLHTSGFLDDESPDQDADRALDEALSRAETVLVMSEPVAAHIRERRPRRSGVVRVLPNPASNVDTAAPERAAHADPVRVLTVGEINELKQMSVILSEVEALRSERVEIEYHVVGPWGPLPDAERRHLEHSDACVLHGTQRGPALTELYDRADVFVLFSRNEAEPLSLLEAMGRGLPCIAPAVGSIPSLLVPVPGNVVVPAGDRSSLREALRRLAQDPQLRGDVGAANARWVRERRSPAAHLAELTTIYADALRPTVAS
ncbi:glycosyltransferase family 4 protein [Janibacter anophelis]|uniref:glycosyltransferase family 4 protein n=2 Tax=Janibacter anophelis TaxID=319054 RepID=UPI0039F02073